MISFGALLPHPPIIVSGIGGAEDLAQVAETVKAISEINRILTAEPPETLVVFTPHGTVYQDAIVVYGDPRAVWGFRTVWFRPVLVLGE